MDIQEFYKDKEKRDLIDTITNAKWITEAQKAAMIGFMEDYEDEDDVQSDLRDLQKKQKEYDYGDDEYEALEDRIDAKRKKIKDIRFRDSQQRARDQERAKKQGRKIGIGGGLGS